MYRFVTAGQWVMVIPLKWPWRKGLHVSYKCTGTDNIINTKQWTTLSYAHSMAYNITIRRYSIHDDVIKWKHFSRNWPFVRGIHRSPVNSPHKGQWRGALMFTLICVWINDWVNNREAGDLRRYRSHYDVIVMITIRWYSIPGAGNQYVILQTASRDTPWK